MFRLDRPAALPAGQLLMAGPYGREHAPAGGQPLLRIFGAMVFFKPWRSMGNQPAAPRWPVSCLSGRIAWQGAGVALTASGQLITAISMKLPKPS
jgi:hypothetical protein